MDTSNERNKSNSAKANQVRAAAAAAAATTTTTTTAATAATATQAKVAPHFNSPGMPILCSELLAPCNSFYTYGLQISIVEMLLPWTNQIMVKALPCTRTMKEGPYEVEATHKTLDVCLCAVPWHSKRARRTPADSIAINWIWKKKLDTIKYEVPLDVDDALQSRDVDDALHSRSNMKCTEEGATQVRKDECFGCQPILS
eukprot:6178595-Amphidinium_carterae.1